MVQLDEELYNKIKKDADDNRQIRSIIRWIIGLIIFLVLYFTAGQHLLNIQVQKAQAAADREMAILQAQINVRIREIESEGLTTEEYLKWYKIHHQVEE